MFKGVAAVGLLDTAVQPSCPSGATQVTWNEQGQPGPAGAPGAQGPVGPPGADGAQGPAGPTNLVIREGPVSDISGTSLASCNAGERATGGGGVAFGAAPGNNGLRVSFPTPLVVGGTPTGWRVVGESQDATVKAFVVCAS
jgi:hypothetical protein